MLICGQARAQDDPFALLFGDAVDAGSEDRPGEDDVRFVGVRLGDLRLKNTLTSYQRAEGLCVIAADMFALLEASVDVTVSEATGWFLSPEQTLLIDLESATAMMGGSESLDLSGQIFATSDGWCMTSAAWSRILPIDFAYDPASLTLHLQPRQLLPIEARLEREALRSLLKPEQGPVRPDYRQVKRPYRWMSWPTADITLDVSGQKDAETDLQGSVELAGDLLFATARMRTAENDQGDLGLRLSFERVLDPGDSRVQPKQIRFGDVVGPGHPLIGKPETGRGVTITNRPAYLVDIFDTTDIRGPLPEGWEAELHREGLLVAFVESPNSQGEYVFPEVEIRPGYNRFTVKLFGPFGEEQARAVKIFAGQEMHPENEVQYEFALIEEGITLDGQSTGIHRPAASASLNYGLSRRLTVQLDAKATALGEAAATTSLAGAYGDTHGVVRLAGSNFGGPAAEVGLVHLFQDRSSLDVRYEWNGGLAPLSARQEIAPPRQTLRLDYDTMLPVIRHGLPTRARMAWQEALDGSNRLNVGLQAGSSHHGWRWSQTAFLERIWGMESPSSNSFRGGLSLARTLSGVRIRGGLDYEAVPKASLRSAEISAQRRLRDGGFGQLSLNRDMQTGRTQMAAAYSRDFGRFALSATGGIDDTGRWSAGLRLAASLFFDPRKGRYQSALPGLTRTGAVRANVFDDLDGDGVYSSGDRAVEGASFIVDQSVRKEESGADGGVTLGSMDPHRTINLELSLGSLDDPFLQPVEPGLAVTLRPGQVLDINVPLTLSGEADGTLVLLKGENEVPVAGVLVQAISAAGNVVGEALTEYDGYVYLDGLPMGQLEIRVSPEALGSVEGRSEAIPIMLTRDEPSAFGVRLAIANHAESPE
ncbi:MAG: hypothetical protein AAF829_05815 [Pseudomonadota bacterium]